MLAVHWILRSKSVRDNFIKRDNKKILIIFSQPARNSGHNSTKEKFCTYATIPLEARFIKLSSLMKGNWDIMDMSLLSKRKRLWCPVLIPGVLCFRAICPFVCPSVIRLHACLSFWQPVRDTPFASMTTVKILNIGTRMSEQTV